MSTPAMVINGTSGAYEQPQKFGWDANGPYCVRTWRGTAAAIASQYNVCVGAGATADVAAGYGVHTLTARYALAIGGTGPNEVPVESWEFFASHVEKDLLEADNATINSISELNRSIIHKLLTDPSQVAEDPDGGGYFDDDGSAAAALSVYKLMNGGMKSVRVMAPALRHTQTVSNQYTLKAALTNVGAIISTATLKTSENVPTGVLFNLPAKVSVKTGYAWAWMKMHPTIRCAARQKMQIEQEWEYGLWTTLIYGNPL
ncbi:MAG: hypothetical protein NT154_17500 [Verrucomicrobia bacterium]|nr:hypothetical protein [Verrucomicrobiota bacterium]